MTHMTKIEGQAAMQRTHGKEGLSWLPTASLEHGSHSRAALPFRDLLLTYQGALRGPCLLCLDVCSLVTFVYQQKDCKGSDWSLPSSFHSVCSSGWSFLSAPLVLLFSSSLSLVGCQVQLWVTLSSVPVIGTSFIMVFSFSFQSGNA